jgi:hypothetical protein
MQAYCGFYSTLKEVNHAAVCTGNWGCGAFGGDRQLKGQRALLFFIIIIIVVISSL